jgi:CDP-diacylglycerol--glycerol-3-phosphate 3-phosphatidyltransferase
MKLPNILTIIRIILAPVYLLLLVGWSDARSDGSMFALIITMIVLGVSIISDGLDGYLARRLSLTSRLGMLLDPIADKLLVIPALIWLSHIGAVSVFVVIIITARELLVSAFRLLASSRGTDIGAGFMGKVKTVSEYALLIIITLLIRSAPTDLTFVMSWICAALAVLSAGEYFYSNRGLFQDILSPNNKDQSGAI